MSGGIYNRKKKWFSLLDKCPFGFNQLFRYLIYESFLSCFLWTRYFSCIRFMWYVNCTKLHYVYANSTKDPCPLKEIPMDRWNLCCLLIIGWKKENFLGPYSLSLWQLLMSLPCNHLENSSYWEGQIIKCCIVDCNEIWFILYNVPIFNSQN